MPIGVRQAERAEYDDLADLLTRAFLDDPVIEWFFPDPEQRPRRLRRFFAEIALGIGLSQSTEVYTTEDRGAVAVWAPPDRWRVSVLRQLRILPRYLAIASIRWAPSRLAGFNQIEGHHPHGPPHWYLPTLGTDPSRQGQGLGSALLDDMLGRCDTAGLPAYLESSKAANVPFYERHGFEVTETFELPRGPRMWFMWRDPR
jgi:ribosomal protein S18 acetylase RimI-like enzyme